MKRLALVLRIQAVVFVGYGLSFLLAPDFTLDTIFGWEGAQTMFARMVGAAFLGLAWLGWLIATHLESRLDMVWPLVLVPVLLFAVLVGEKVADNYQGSDLFFWVSVGVTVFFAVAVGGSRLALGRTDARVSAST